MLYRISALCLIVILSGCVNTKKFIYFNDLKKMNAVDTSINLQSILIQKGDILQITVASAEPSISSLFNPITSINGGAVNNNNQIAQGYVVDSSGNVELPMIGKVYVKGKSTFDANEAIKHELEKQIKNFFVATRFLNFRISVLGDVARPGSYNIQNERVSLLDALSMAGDLNITAVRNDVMLIREIEGKKTYVSLDLNDSKTLSSPYFYLATNDVLYVKPTYTRVAGSTLGFQLLPTIFSALSFALVFITTVIRNN